MEQGGALTSDASRGGGGGSGAVLEEGTLLPADRLRRAHPQNCSGRGWDVTKRRGAKACTGGTQLALPLSQRVKETVNLRRKLILYENFFAYAAFLHTTWPL